jgi:hypothetical protein
MAIWQQECMDCMKRAISRAQELESVLPNVVNLHRAVTLLASDQFKSRSRISNKSLVSLLEQKQL